MCTIYGYSGNTEGVASCLAGVNKRTIICQPGYTAIGASTPDGPSVELIGTATFRGCRRMYPPSSKKSHNLQVIDNCALYGFSGNSANTRACVTGKNQRTIICERGYYAGVNHTDSVTLIGNAEFEGCFITDNCVVYGYSGLPKNTSSCVSGLNQRTITCAVGFFPTNNAMNRRDITLVGSTPFEGCERKLRNLGTG
jgi:hypothetical protein